MERDALDAAALDWIREGALAPRDEGRFDRLALDLFAHQYAHNPAYRRLCNALNATPERVQRWQEIPPVPTGAFKEARLASFPADHEVRRFRTSGTTTQRRGTLHLDTLALYEASLLASFAAYICVEHARIRLFVLAPSAADVPDSSLSHMFSVACRQLGLPGSRAYADAEGWAPEPLMRELGAAREPVAVVGTAFAFVHLLDALSAGRIDLKLPEGSRVMETGGFKGRSRSLSRRELHGGIGAALGVPEHRIVNQYGMCELASQFYEDSLRTGVATCVKSVPPWVRTRVLDPYTLRELPAGQEGVLVHYDLANTGSVLAVQTSDVGRAVGDGFEVLGRLEGAEARGCSIAADALLTGA